MIKLIQETFEQIARLSQEQQDTLATYLKKHLAEFLEEAEKERRIAEGNYTISDFNQKTQQAIQNIEEQKTLTVCKDEVELYRQLGIYCH
jgi:biotin-(acetyl-CoA carboxylase) ligase